jgi:para-nitrobenzyl esterase
MKTQPKMVITPESLPVTVENFVRAETDMYFAKTALNGGFARFRHYRQMAEIDKQDVVRMNRDTIYSRGVFDLNAAPLTITLPDTRKRFMSMQVISEDHYTIEVVYAPGRFIYTKDKVGTRYVFIIIRTLADPQNWLDLKAANALQDAIKVEQPRSGWFETPNWDLGSQSKIREALIDLGPFCGAKPMFGRSREVHPVSHLIGSAIRWGGNPKSAAVYLVGFPKANDGRIVHRLTVKDVPVDGFWSISLYNANGYFEKNDFDAYSLNSLTAKPDADGSITIQFGGCGKDVPNFLPIIPGWNYMVRLYRPGPEILTGKWTFPDITQVDSNGVRNEYPGQNWFRADSLKRKEG